MSIMYIYKKLALLQTFFPVRILRSAAKFPRLLLPLLSVECDYYTLYACTIYAWYICLKVPRETTGWTLAKRTPRTYSRQR